MNFSLRGVRFHLLTGLLVMLTSAGWMGLNARPMNTQQLHNEPSRVYGWPFPAFTPDFPVVFMVKKDRLGPGCVELGRVTIDIPMLLANLACFLLIVGGVGIVTEVWMRKRT